MVSKRPQRAGLYFLADWGAGPPKAGQESVRTSASSGLSDPVGIEPSSSGLQVGALSGEVWHRKGGGLAEFCRRLAAGLPGPEPVGTSTRTLALTPGGGGAGR